jgi:hypothetical protein
MGEADLARPAAMTTAEHIEFSESTTRGKGQADGGGCRLREAIRARERPGDLRIIRTFRTGSGVAVKANRT